MKKSPGPRRPKRPDEHMGVWVVLTDEDVRRAMQDSVESYKDLLTRLGRSKLPSRRAAGHIDGMVLSSRALKSALQQRISELLDLAATLPRGVRYRLSLAEALGLRRSYMSPAEVYDDLEDHGRPGEEDRQIKH